jgi:hypothetical protein
MLPATLLATVSYSVQILFSIPVVRRSCRILIGAVYLVFAVGLPISWVCR